MEKDSRIFKSKLKELEPTIRSLNMEELFNRPLDKAPPTGSERQSKKSVQIAPMSLVKMESKRTRLTKVCH